MVEKIPKLVVNSRPKRRIEIIIKKINKIMNNRIRNINYPSTTSFEFKSNSPGVKIAFVN